MCNSLAEGGKRCAAHMSGTRAAVKEAEVYTKQNKGVLTQVFNFLRKEGKNVESPSKEDIQAYADTQRVRARFDPTLSNRERNMIIRNWQKARDESPDGGTFHAWKNLRSETARRVRKTFVGLTLVGTIATAGACGNTQPPNEETPAPSPTATTEVTEAPETSEKHIEGVSFELSDGFTAGDPLSTTHGDYQPVQLADDSPLRIYDPATADEHVIANHTPEEIEAGQNLVAEFIVESAIDSPLVFDYSPENSQQWWEENENYFNPDNITQFRDNIVDTDTRSSIVDNNAGAVTFDEQGVPSATEGWLRGTPVLDGGVRKGDLSVELVGITGAENTPNYLVFEYDVHYKHAITDPRGEIEGVFAENNDANFNFHLRKYNGSWKIDGSNNTIRTTISN